MTKEYDKEVLVSFFLRIGLAISFFYAAISSFVAPENWIGYFPGFLREFWVLTLFSIYELALGGWLLSHKKTFYAAVVSAVTLFFIVVFNWTLMDIVFRDIGLFFMALALAALTRRQ